METEIIHVKATSVEDLKNGVFAISVPVREIENVKREMLSDLFPNTLAQVSKILTIENLIASVAKDSEIQQKAPIKKNDPPIEPTPVECSPFRKKS